MSLPEGVSPHIRQALERIATGVRVCATDESFIVGYPGKIENPGRWIVYDLSEIDYARRAYLALCEQRRG